MESKQVRMVDVTPKEETERQAVAKAEEARGPGRTVLFHFEQKGVNAHTANGSFTYDTPEMAQKAAERMNLQDKFNDVRIV